MDDENGKTEHVGYSVVRYDRWTQTENQMVATGRYGHALAVFADTCQVAGDGQSVRLFEHSIQNKAGRQVFGLDRTSNEPLRLTGRN